MEDFTDRLVDVFVFGMVALLLFGIGDTILTGLDQNDLSIMLKCSHLDAPY